ncbi:uncharacterized protein METZ01_LOCUS124141 [marine metagenome]|uniref:Uncharacterized protein n=1 Tax=marine metagenome TaxID=408172 RepID=A0A381Y4H5_9ZZZZ
MLAHNLNILYFKNNTDYVNNRLTKIVSICDEQIETINKIVNDHAKEGERNA